MITNDGFPENALYCTMHCVQCTLEKQCTANHIIIFNYSSMPKRHRWFDLLWFNLEYGLVITYHFIVSMQFLNHTLNLAVVWLTSARKRGPRCDDYFTASFTGSFFENTFAFFSVWIKYDLKRIHILQASHQLRWHLWYMCVTDNEFCDNSGKRKK